MSDIVLSSSVRQNLLSLQSTAELLSTTQSRLATGKKVNTALDNPTNYFTASALDSRASDINNLLDGIGNGVQILQAANTGITSLQKLVDSAKSVANQALQTTVGYNQKSAVTTTVIAGATVDNLLGGASAATSAAYEGTPATASSLSAYTSATTTPGAALKVGDSGAFADNSTLISDLTDGTDLASTGPAAGDAFSINGKTITFGATGAATDDGSGNITIGIDQTIGALLTAIDGITGGTGSAINGATGQITLSTGTAASLVVADDATNPALAALGLSAGTTARGGGTATTPALSGATLLSGTASTSNSVLSTAFAAGNTIQVNGTDAAHTLTFVAGAAANANEISIGADVSTLLAQIDALSGGTGSAVSGGKITLNTGTASDLTVTSSNVAAFTALGLGTTGTITQAMTPGGTSQLEGKTLTIGSTGGGAATNIVFGTADGQVKSLNDLNAKLAANHMQASLSTDGKLTITTTNDAASATIGTIGGTAADAGGPFNGLVGAAPTSDPVALQTRANLVTQYNNIIDQIRTTAQDSSFNGVNLLNGDQLKLTFNETGSSTLNITGVVFNPAGLGLGTLTSGTDFIDNVATNKVLASLNDASGTLRSQASALGSNLSVVQIRQNFSKSLINVLQTGSANLTLADTNEEAANSQALATRQSIAVSALALANQSQQSVLQLLR